MVIIKIKNDVKSITNCHNCPFISYDGDGYEGVWRCGLTQKVVHEGSPYDLEIREDDADNREYYNMMMNKMQKYHDSNCPIVEITEE